MTETTRRPAPWMVDAIIAVLIFTAGAAVGGMYRDVFLASGAPEENGVYQEFGAAVALTCGHGFVDPGYAPTPAVGEFLAHKRDRITCADLPRDVRTQRPNMTQGLYRYLMTAAVLVWRPRGVMSWNALTPLFAAEYGLTLVAAYGIFRIGIGRVMSVVATVALLVSAIHLAFLPYLRDYSKAPFVLGLIWIMARLAVRPLTWRRAATFGAAFGVVLGIGFGFRNDILINIVPWIAVVLLCVPGKPWSRPKQKALCLAVSAAVFVVTAWPILAAYSRGSNSGHVTFLGLQTGFNEPLGIGASIYDWGYFYNDGFANRTINSFTYRREGKPVAYFSAEYDRAMFVYLLTIVRHWPADMVARVYGAALKVFEMPFTVGVYQNAFPYGIRHPTVLAIYDAQMSVLRALNGMGVAAVALALLVISARSVRTAVTVLLFLVYFAGYPAIQFSIRHFFHLEFIGWAALAFLIDRAAVTAWRRVRPRKALEAVPVDPPRRSRTAVRVLAFAALATVLVGGSLLVLRWYQAAHLRTLFDRSYLGAEREPVEVVKGSASAGRVLFDASAIWGKRNPAEETSSEYIVATFSPARCHLMSVQATFRYQAAVADADYSHDVTVRLAEGDQSTFVFFPAYFDAVWSHFKGIELAEATADCLVGVSRVRRDRTPDVMIDATFPAPWPHAKLYQTLTRFETPSDGEMVPTVYTKPPTLAVPAGIQPARFVPPKPEAEYYEPIVKQGPDASLIIKGRAFAPLGQIMVLAGQTLPAGAIVVARGEVRAGGITIALIPSTGGAWITFVNITAPGPFIAALSIPKDDTYSLTMANCIQGGWIERHLAPRPAAWLLSLPVLARQNDVVVRTLGWIPPPAPVREEAAR